MRSATLPPIRRRAASILRRPPVRVAALAAFAALAALSVAAGCDDGPTADPEPPRIRFEPQAVVFPTGAAGAGLTTVVRAVVTGVGPAPTLHWASRAPDAVAIDRVLEDGRVVVLRGVMPRATFVTLTARGTATVTDSLPVGVLAR